MIHKQLAVITNVYRKRDRMLEKNSRTRLRPSLMLFSVIFVVSNIDDEMNY